MFSLSECGSTNTARSFDVRTQKGAYAGTITEVYGRHFRVFFNMSATRGSTRRFATMEDALSFIHARRTAKGWSI